MSLLCEDTIYQCSLQYLICYAGLFMHYAQWYILSKLLYCMLTWNMTYSKLLEDKITPNFISKVKVMYIVNL